MKNKSRTTLEVIPKEDLGGTSEVNSVCLLRKNSEGHTMHGRIPGWTPAGLTWIIFRTIFGAILVLISLD